MVKFAAIGGQRYVKSVYPDNIGAVYTEKQMITRKALISKNFYTQDMYEEDLHAVANAAKVKEAGFPTDIPMLVIFRIRSCARILTMMHLCVKNTRGLLKKCTEHRRMPAHRMRIR